MNERQIPVAARGRWPILATDEHPLWLVGHVLDHRAKVKEREQITLKVQAAERKLETS